MRASYSRGLSAESGWERGASKVSGGWKQDKYLDRGQHVGMLEHKELGGCKHLSGWNTEFEEGRAMIGPER